MRPPAGRKPVGGRDFAFFPLLQCGVASRIKRGHVWTWGIVDLVFRDRVLDRVWGSLDQNTCSSPV